MTQAELDYTEATLKAHYEFTVGGRESPGAADDKEATVLNKVIRLTDIGVEYEADVIPDKSNDFSKN